MKIMNNRFVLKISPRFEKLRTALLSCALAFSVGNTAYAEDIEIYKGITAAEVANGGAIEVAKPNLLLVLDTSGSMKTPEPVKVTGEYNPNSVYGGGTLDENYYLYTAGGVYTGVRVNENRNHCQASKNFLNDPRNSHFPAYFDKALTWELRDTRTEPAANCPDNIIDQSSFLVSDNTSTGLMPVHSFAIPNNAQDYDFEFTADNYSGQIMVVYLDAFGQILYDDGRVWSGATVPNYNDFECFDDVVAGANYSCTLDNIPNVTVAPGPDPDTERAEAVEVVVYFNSVAGTGDGDASVKVSQPGVCPDVVVTATGSWVNVFDRYTDNVSVRAIECRADYGVHGNNGRNSARNSYARNAGNPENRPRNPKYSRSESGANNIVWSSPAIDEKYIYSGNYHQFLLTPIADRINLAVTNPATLAFNQTLTRFCNTSSGFLVFPNNEKYVLDALGVPYQCVSRVKSLKLATKRVLQSLDSANVGLMRLNGSSGGTVLAAVDDISKVDGAGNEVHRNFLLDVVAQLPADGATPLQETMYTAFRYYAGGNVINNTMNKSRAIAGQGNVFDPVVEQTRADLTDPNAKTAGGSKFKSPINQCQDNNIILLSDGQPSNDQNYRSQINYLSSLRTDPGKPTSSCGSHSGGCLDELTGYMANQDVFNLPNSSTGRDESGKNVVYTYTVAFGSSLVSNSYGDRVLKEASDAALRASDSVQHYNAVNADELATAFNSIVTNLSIVANDSFVSPAVAVNAFNRLQFRDDLYYAVFKPGNTVRWNGNLKKYKIGFTGAGKASILGRDGLDAIGNNGFFTSDAKSYWQPENPDGTLLDIADGPSVELGGVANQLNVTSDQRKLYISLDSSVQEATLLTESNFLTTLVNSLSGGVTPVSGGTLPSGLLESASGAILPSLGQVADPDLDINTDNIVNWTLGMDPTEELGGQATDPNYFLGESLHGAPFVANYGTASAPNDVLFFTTNQGLIHAVDGDTGKERWAYIPDKSLLPNLGAYFNDAVSDTHRYGLDGELSFNLKRDDSGDIEEAIMYLGQRRGGSKYFAIDVTNAALDNPSQDPVKNLWTLEDLPRMGQSWARPVPAVVNYCTSSLPNSCSDTKVLFISGGYDTQYDDLIDPSIDPTGQATAISSLAGNVAGNAIYMVRESTGELLWMAGRNTSQVDTTVAYLTNDDMQHSFPSEPTLVDADFDGVIDFFYAIDISGQVWRFDFSGDVSVTPPATGSSAPAVVLVDENDIVAGNNNLSKETAGGVIAKLSDPSDNRRFYNRLDISLSPRTDSDLSKFNIVAGSGYRGHPLTFESNGNRMYFLYDRNIRFPKFTADSNGLPEEVTYDYADGNSVIEDTDIPQKINGTAIDTRPAYGSSPAGDNYHGFYIELAASSSEKMLNPSLTDGGKVFAVSYSPESIVNDSAGNLCEKNAGSSSLYQIDLKTGEYTRLTLDKGGISAKPVIIEIPAPGGGTGTGTGGNGGGVTDPDAGDPDTVKILIIGTEVFGEKPPSGSGPNDPPECDPTVEVCLTPSDTGSVNKVNWWERRK